MNRKQLCMALLCMLIAAVISFSMLPASAENTSSDSAPAPSLDEMTESECIAYVEAHGIEIPGDPETWGPIIQSCIRAACNGRCISKSFNDSRTIDFLEKVENLVFENCSSTINPLFILPSYSTNNLVMVMSLRDSFTNFYWSDFYNNYNCYSYARDITNYAYDPGMLSNYLYSEITLAEIKYATLKDLKKIYTCVSSYTTLSSGRLSYGSTICLRVHAGIDYHFMKYDGNAWTHKPGQTIPLTYKYEPSNDRLWRVEYKDCDNRYYYDDLFEYDSDIVFFTFGNTHTYENRRTGEHYHSGKYHYFQYADVCLNCGNEINYTWQRTACSGSPCMIDWSNLPYVNEVA